MWNRAEEGAQIGSYVIADADGRRFEYKETVDQEACRRAEAERYTDRYFRVVTEWADEPYRLRMAMLDIPPYFVCGERCMDRAVIFAHELSRVESGNPTYSSPEFKEFKKFPDLGRAKQRVLYLVGYYNQFGEMGMLNNRFQIPPWSDNWFIWSATKDGEIIEPVLKIAEYVATTQKYADLSKTFGVEAKEVFKKIENADPAPAGVVIIGKFDGGEYCDDLRFVEDPNFVVDHDGQQIGEGSGYIFNATGMAAIKEVAKMFKIKKVGKTRAAFAALSLNDAVMIKLAYTGSLQVKIIDMNKMEELV